MSEFQWKSSKAVKKNKAILKLKRIAGRLIMELERGLSEALGTQREDLEMFKKVLNQQRGDKNKIYSLHKSYTACIAKGKTGIR